MLTEAFHSFAFWVGLLLPLLATFVVFFGQARRSDKAFEKDSNPKRIHANAFRNPINLGITVSGLVIPLTTAFIAFLFGKQHKSATELSLLFASLLILLLAVAVGLWNSYSLATATDEEDVFEISKTESTYFPAQFVSQLTLLLGGIFLIVIYCFYFLDVPTLPEVRCVPEDRRPILRRPVTLGISEDELRATWGSPSEIQTTTDGQRYKYFTPTSEFLLTVRDGSVIEIIERSSPPVGE